MLNNHYKLCSIIQWPSIFYTNILIIDGYIYGVEGGVEVHHASLRCLDAETGEVKWDENLKYPRTKSVSLIAADGKLIFLEDDGTLHIAKATPVIFKEISRGDVLEGEKKNRKFWTLPVLYNGKIYVRNYFGDLICIDMSK